MVAHEEFHGDVNTTGSFSTVFEFGVRRGVDDDAALLALASDDFRGENEYPATGDDLAHAFFANWDGDVAIALHRRSEDPLFVVERNEPGAVDGLAGFEANAGVFDRGSAQTGVEDRLTTERFGEQKAHQEHER